MRQPRGLRICAGTLDDMTDSKEQDRKTTLSLGGSKGKLELRKGADGNQVRQSFSHGRSKTVQVEVKRKRSLEKAVDRGPAGDLADGGAAARRSAEGGGSSGKSQRGGGKAAGSGARTLTTAERESRERALRLMREDSEAKAQAAQQAAAEEAVRKQQEAERQAAEPEPVVPQKPLDPETLRQREMEELRGIQEEEERKRREAEEARQEQEERRRREAAPESPPPAESVDSPPDESTTQSQRPSRTPSTPRSFGPSAPAADSEERGGKRGVGKKAEKATPTRTRGDQRRRGSKMTVTQALSGDEGKTRSLASVRRARQKNQRAEQLRQTQEKIVRDVTIPDVITVQELANRMAERAADVIKSLMKMGVMATITQSIDADTAELVVQEFGHKSRRVSEADVEIGLDAGIDDPASLRPRAPVVTVMGHVDHGKTSLLDALRSTDVAGREAGGITQHIGAYMITLNTGQAMTFIDTPGHEAFTEMRARGATATDIVVLVVAADDGIMPQTIEAIRHAKAAEVPIIVAINKCDLPDSNPDRVRNELLQHELVPEELGGDIQTVEVSAKAREGLDKLQEAILLQAEILELTANPDRNAEGVVIEAKLERGRGPVATVLIQRGTLRVGDVFVAGSESGRVRALVNDRGQQIEQAGPAEPVEVLGMQGAPNAGDLFVTVETESKAREISEYRHRKRREKEAAVQAGARGSVEQIFSRISEGEAKEFPVVVKGDVQGSVEAIVSSLEKAAGDNIEVKVRVLHSAVGGINESDVSLASSTGALIIAFNVRANPQARETARRDGVEIRYYSVIYNVIDDIKAALTGMLSPVMRESFIGNASIREVFNITKVGKVAGCMVTDGVVKRGAGVRLLRDNVVVHEGRLKTLKRFKDEVKEVREGFECGMAFENYENIQAGDVIECFEVEEIARQL